MDTLACMEGLLHQGYTFAKPMTADALGAWLARNEEGKPPGPFPKSLHGWYGHHINRFMVMRVALYTIADLLSSEGVQDAPKCPLHNMIARIRGDAELERGHRDWQANFARFTAMVQAGAIIDELWCAMEASKNEFRKLVERKLRTPAAPAPD